jgi:hypothetical protein
MGGSNPVTRTHEDAPEVVSGQILRELVAEPKSASEKLYAVWARWTRAGKEQSLQVLAVMLREALKLPELVPLARGYATVCLGWIMQGRLSQVEIEALARTALTLFQQVGEAKGEAEACCLLGQALQKRGSLPEAFREYEFAKRIMLRLTLREPENADFQRNLSVAHACIGSVLQAQGRLGDALGE